MNHKTMATDLLNTGMGDEGRLKFILSCVNVEIHDCRIFLFKSVKALALLFHVWMFCWIALVVA